MDSISVHQSALASPLSLQTTPQATIKANALTQNIAQLGNSALQETKREAHTSLKPIDTGVGYRKSDFSQFYSNSMLMIPDGNGHFISKLGCTCSLEEQRLSQELIINPNGEYVHFGDGPMRDRIIDGKLITVEMQRRATPEEQVLFKAVLSEWKAQAAQTKPAKEAKKEEATTSLEIINQHRNQWQMRSSTLGDNANVVIETNNKEIVVHIMKALTHESIRNIDEQQKKQMEKTEDCMALNMKILAKARLNHDILLHEIEAKLIDS